MKQYSNELKSYNFLQRLKEGYYVDAKEDRQWKVAKIVNIKNTAVRTYVKVRFDGHSNQWNQDFQLPAYQKLAPFRRFSLPYTGPAMQSNRDVNFQNLQTDIKTLGRLEKINTLKPQFINQYIRGELFILVDSILTNKPNLDQQIYRNAIELIKSYIYLGILFLNYGHSNFQEIINDALTQPMLMYVHPKISAFFACIQFLYNFNSLISKNEKRVRFFEISQRLKCQSQADTIRSLIISSGIQKICDDIMNYKNKNQKGYPWNIKKEAFILIQSLTNQKYQFPQITDPKQIADALDYLSYLHKKSTISSQTLQFKQIQLVISLIIFGTFQTKKRGLNELKYIIERSQKSKQVILIQQIKKKKLIENLINNKNFNSQLFKRSISVFEFAQRNGLLNQNHLKQIIQLSKDKHELQIANFYSALSQFGKFLNDRSVVSFFKQITQLQKDENMILLIRQYTLAVTNYHPTYKKRYFNQDLGFGVLFFLELINSVQFNNQSLRNKVIENLAALLVSPYYSKHIQNFITLSIKSIKAKKHIDSHLKIIYQAMKICKGQKMNNVIQSIERDMSIIDCVVKAVTQDNTVSQKALQNMFEFLQQVNHVAKKPINAAHIKVFWQMKQCRKYLLKFLRKHRPIKGQDKSHQKIINKQLQRDTIKVICQTIFMNNQLMENYNHIDLETYQTIDELLISYNHHSDIIDYNYKHTLRVKKIDYLFGMKIYINIIIHSKDINISDKSLRRLIQYHLRPISSRGILSSSELTLKINSWKLLLEVLTSLDHFLLRGYSFLLQQIEGRMKSLNILQPIPLKILVQLKQTAKFIILPRYSSLWKLRQVINQQFNLKNTNFQMQFQQSRSKLNFERQEDLSIAAIPSSKDDIPSIIIYPSKQTHPHFTAIEQFKLLFCQTRGQTLYQMLGVENQQIQQLILNILSQLPFIKNLQRNILKLDFSNWDNIMDTKCRSKLKYQLSIINRNKNPKWINGFIQKKGVQHIAKILINRVPNDDYKVFTSLAAFFCQNLKFYRKTNQPLPFNQQFIYQIIKIPQKYIKEDYRLYLIQILSVVLEITNFSLNVSSIFKHSQIYQILQICLFGQHIQNISTNLYQIAQKSSSINLLIQHLNKFLKYEYLQGYSNCCRSFFDLIVLIISKNDIKQFLPKLTQCLKAIRKQNIKQKSDKQPNWLIEGYLRTIKCLNGNGNLIQTLLNKNQTKEQFLNQILIQNLFPNNQNQDYSYKSQHVRKLCYNLIKQTKQEWIDLRITDIILPMMQRGAWRKQYEWNVKAFEITNKKYTGLKNLSATCYINSLIQQLYFINSFRQRILHVNSKQITHKQNISYEIQKIFGFLKYSQALSYTTSSLCRNFILDGSPINPRVQMDVDEFFHALMDKLQMNLKEIKEQGIIDQNLRGQYSNLIIGHQCQHTSQRIQHFLSMRVQIKNKNTIYQALEQFIKKQVLQGDNAYFCQKCNAKVKAHKRVCIKSLPNVLILTLKRFQFDFETMQKFKLNTFCSFPLQLNMLPFTRQYLYRDPQNNGQIEGGSYRYKLKGVVIHYGISQAGHYTSYVHTPHGWQYFDDQKVQPFDINEIQQQCFGGIESNPFGDDQQKRKNAYLLFYQKIDIKQFGQLQINKDILKQVQEDNLKQKFIRILFDDGLQSYILNSNTLNTILLYFHLVTLRSYNKTNIVNYYAKCEQIIQGSKQWSKWYLQQIDQWFIDQFLIFGDKDAKYLVTSLIIAALKNASNIQFYKRCVKSCLTRKNIMMVAKILKYACGINNQCTKTLAQSNFGQKALKYLRDGGNPQNLTSTITVNRTQQFGRHFGQFYQKKDNSQSIHILQAIEALKVNVEIQWIDIYAFKCKKLQTRKSLSKIVAKKYKDMESFTKLFNDYLHERILNFQPKINEEYTYQFLIILIKQIAQFQDENTPKRHIALINIYTQAMKDALAGYMNMKILLEGLYTICSSNPIFRDRMSDHLNGNKQNQKILKLIKQWLKETANVGYNIKTTKWAYWKKYKSTFIITNNHIQSIQKIQIEKFLNFFNSLSQKHNIPADQQKQAIIGSIVLIDPLPESRSFNKVKGKVENKLGLLLQVKTEDETQRFVPSDQVILIP